MRTPRRDLASRRRPSDPLSYGPRPAPPLVRPAPCARTARRGAPPCGSRPRAARDPGRAAR
ncbi:hypothetical protein CA984_28985 [Streptosporangium minutum]|uniref:Uncharacterized protein n=1 Tax=Streptosporangium minutum TaxID=569862 RepID=A0A243RF78_9ACTN|nr:hypothetical protein CA984_28985 [Streptosporangium minutum]